MTLKDIRIGTLVKGGDGAADYIRQIIGYGFESFSLTFWQTLGDTNLEALAKSVKEVLADHDAVISSIGVFGNPLGDKPIDQTTREDWGKLIDAAPLFGCDIVAGFAGRVVDKPIDASMGRFAEVFGPLAKKAADKGVRLAFENCDMGGDWNRGDWNIAQNPTAWEMMFNAVDAPNVGLEWEPCHQMVSLIDPIPQLRQWVDKIFHVHGKDATVNWDVVKQHGVHGPYPFAYHRTPGFGDSNWTDIITILRQNNFCGSIDIEGWHDPVYKDELEMTGQVRGLHYLKECRGGNEFIANPS